MGYISESMYYLLKLTGRRQVLGNTQSSGIPRGELKFRLTSYSCWNRAHAKNAFDLRYPETPFVMGERTWLVPANRTPICT